MANRRAPNNPRRNDFQQRNDRSKNFGRPGLSPWQGAGPGTGLPNLLPLAGGSTEATLALASNIINLLQPRQNPVPSLLDMPIRRDFGPNMGRFDRGYNNNRMGNQNFRRTGNYNRTGERINTNRKNFRPNEGQKQQNKTTPKKEADSKAKPVKESEEEKPTTQDEPAPEKKETATEEQKEKKEAPKTRYDDINPQLLKCHICNKSMWDGRSFENHLNGRAHAIMMQKTAESYALTADTMRQEFKIREMKRTRKQGGGPMSREFYCAMCDMYAAEGGAHRTTVGHRKLKKYLHPACTACRKEMPTRIELDEHRLTAEHLRNMQDKQDIIAKPKPEVMVISTLSMEQSYVRDDRQQRRRRHHDDREASEAKDKEETADGEVKVKQEGEEGETEEKKQEAESEEPVNIDNEDTITDYVEGEDIGTITTDRFPVYSTERGVGASFLAEFRCVQCKLCRKLLEDDAAAEVHLRTWRHHQLFTRMLNDKANNKQKSEETQEEESQPTNQKRPLNCEESGNWKRRKTTPDPDSEDVDNHMDNTHVKEEEIEEENDVEQNVDGDGDQEMPSADDLEDWNQQGQQDNQNDNNEQEETAPVEAEPVEEEKQEPAPKMAAPATPATRNVARSPRGSPRGRGRARGRRY